MLVHRAGFQSELCVVGWSHESWRLTTHEDSEQTPKYLSKVASLFTPQLATLTIPHLFLKINQ